jgi:hypothetical protein
MNRGRLAWTGALPGMLTVWADPVDEAWDKDQLRSVLGSRSKI